MHVLSKKLCINPQVFYYLIKTIEILYVCAILLIIENGEIFSVQNAHTI